MIDTGDILLPTAYFPPVSYFAFLIRSKNAEIEQMETFPKQTCRNRFEIMAASGKVKLIIPVTKLQGNHTLTANIEICYREPWRERHWKTLQSAYRSSPFFSYYADIIHPLFESREILLVRHNQAILRTISSLIGFDPSVELTRDYIKEPRSQSDLRIKFSADKNLLVNEFPRYPQVFDHKFGFIPDLSILDLLFNLGPEVKRYLNGIE